MYSVLEESCLALREDVAQLPNNRSHLNLKLLWNQCFGSGSAGSIVIFRFRIRYEISDPESSQTRGVSYWKIRLISHVPYYLKMLYIQKVLEDFRRINLSMISNKQTLCKKLQAEFDFKSETFWTVRSETHSFRTATQRYLTVLLSVQANIFHTVHINLIVFMVLSGLMSTVYFYFHRLDNAI